MPDTATNLEELIDRLDKVACEQDPVTVKTVMGAVGSRSFGPLLLTAGLILATPLSGIPGLPTTMAVFVFSVAVQLLLRRDHFWMPAWILNRSISSSRLQIGLKGLRWPARIIDRPLRPRLRGLTYSGGSRVVALVCILIVSILPPLEFVPFAATIIGVALAAFGLSLIAHDGLLALLAYALTAVAAVWLISVLPLF